MNSSNVKETELTTFAKGRKGWCKTLTAIKLLLSDEGYPLAKAYSNNAFEDKGFSDQAFEDVWRGINLWDIRQCSEATRHLKRHWWKNKSRVLAIAGHNHV